MRIVDIYAVGRERTEEEKRRRHLYGDKGAKFSQGKRLCLLGGGNRMRDYDGDERQFSLRDI
jgi:hypothetical protein